MTSIINIHRNVLTGIVLLGCTLWPITFSSWTYAGGYDQVAPVNQSAMLNYTDRLIIKLRADSTARYIAGVQTKPMKMSERVASLSASTGIAGLAYEREMSGGAQVVKLSGMLSLSQVRELAKRLADNPDVEYVEPDLIMQPMAIPNDTHYGLQWHYHSSISEAGAVNLPAAWDITTGHPDITVAVIDTGILPHTDLIGRTVSGYDFITNVLTANDGNGRDADPTDPGDWITAGESSGVTAGGYFVGCSETISTWHGTHIAGLIGAVANNNSGVAGVNWVSKILPVRVLGKCGGYSSDIIDGMRWAAGFPVSGVPANANAADVLNLSFGAISSCTTSYQNALDDIMAAGKVVVVAAGNSAVDVVNQTPANCNNVITVAANNRAGGLASYSNFGARIDITAPGGDYPLDPNGIASTLDQGVTNALNDNSYSYYQGTSMAAPHVSGIASLMLSANYSLTGILISPALIEQKIKATARIFPAGTGTDCTVSHCGAGIIDADAAVRSVITPPVADAGVNMTVDTGSVVNLDAGNSSDDGSINSYLWSQISGPTVNLNDINGAMPSFAAPDEADVLVFQVTVTDDIGITATDTVDITVIAYNDAPVASNGSLTISEDTPGNDNLVASDADDDILIYSIVSNGMKGTAVITDINTGAYTFTPGTDNFGVDSFTFKVNDGSVDSNIATITVTIDAVSNSATITSSTNSANSGGGGGSMDIMMLSFYGLIFLIPYYRRKLITQ